MICDTLTKIGTLEHTSMTVLQWETLFSKVVNTLDKLPIANGNATSSGNLGSEIITAKVWQEQLQIVRRRWYSY